MAKEKNLEDKLIRGCKTLGALCEKYPPIFWAGVPDRLIIAPNGAVIWVEMKAPNGVLSPIQRKVHKALKARKQRVEVLYSDEHVQIFLRSLAHGEHKPLISAITHARKPQQSTSYIL